MVKVLSVGGSIVVPDNPDIDFLKTFTKMIREWVVENSERKLILVVGGGGPARVYQNAYRAIIENKDKFDNNEADWIGIAATRLNAQLLKAIFTDLCPQDVVYDPTTVEKLNGRILIAAGWKPGFSTDTDAVWLGEKFGAKTIINLSNIEQVYTDDPKTNPHAQPLAAISWKDFRAMVGDEWIPGKNCPFDPIASKRAEEKGMRVVCAGGRDIKNIKKILDEQDFFGTIIG
ncbi:MAG TPA: UMP kinase [Treponemataceae bacterium]|nr:UMP kinase [Treponemataceae bacterium]